MTRLKSHHPSLVRTTSALLFALSVASLAHADTAPVADEQWHGAMSLGAANASGNTNSTNVTGTLDLHRLTSTDKITLYSYANYASSKVDGTKTTSANSLRLGGRYDYNLTPAAFLFTTAEGETNKAADLRSRYSAAVGAGYKLINTETDTFNIFGGAGGARTEYTTGLSSTGAELYLGEESTHKLSSTTSVNQRLAIHPSGGDRGTLSTFDAGLATKVLGGWTVNTGLSARHQTQQLVGTKSTDTLLTVRFGYKF